MKGRWINYTKKEIYFLEWLSKESGFSENQILKNMRPENQGWANDDILYYNSIKEFKEKIDYSYWLGRMFSWRKSILKPDSIFWGGIDYKWSNIIKQYIKKNYNIKFSKSLIKNGKIIKIKEKDKHLKAKNLKI